MEQSTIKKPFVYIFLFLMTEFFLIMYIFLSNQQWFTITADGKLYLNLAENFVEGHGLINTIRKEDIIVPPLFALFLAPFVLLFKSEAPYFIFQYILYGLNSLLLFVISIKLFKSKAIGVLTTFMYAVHPVILLNGPQFLLTETIFITFILIVCYLSILWLKQDSSNYFYYLMIILSLSLLFRPHLMYVFGIVLVYHIWLVVKKKLKIITAAAYLIPLLFLLLNGLHNQWLHGEFVLLENYSGQNLYLANNPNTSVEFYASTRIDRFVGPEYETYKDYPLSEKSKLLKEKAIDYMIHNPIETIKRLILKSLLFFKGISVLDWILLFVSVVGWILAFIFDRENRHIHLFLLLFIAGFAGLTSAGLLVGGQRYRTPIIPVYLLYGGFCLLGARLLSKQRQ
ncbi:glycosyltransferase family 39 protein [Ferdinandcohnia quinoae]|uniref:Glycosyltransferase family 39 protein n=1 Tax=Fredinandcohnia quinoae TaxID=2918902 RepID=A0AAW5E1F4_9BACI|nr:glycosyltransferase family 39 protein [Fredinandcohnia sp. SECRCQ15]MCH1625100.1 glycosyltransferase family 39 protein [Fredinandcohnia sp. SECRCQ15]